MLVRLLAPSQAVAVDFPEVPADLAAPWVTDATIHT